MMALAHRQDWEKRVNQKMSAIALMSLWFIGVGQEEDSAADYTLVL